MFFHMWVYCKSAVWVYWKSLFTHHTPRLGFMRLGIILCSPVPRETSSALTCRLKNRLWDPKYFHIKPFTEPWTVVKCCPYQPQGCSFVFAYSIEVLGKIVLNKSGCRAASPVHGGPYYRNGDGPYVKCMKFNITLNLNLLVGLYH